MSPKQYRKLWLKLHKSYEKKAFSIFRNALKDAAKKIPFDNLDKYNYVPSIEFNVSQELIYNAYFKAYYQIGLLYGNRVTRGLVKDTKSFEVDSFQQVFKTQLQQWLLENAELRIQTVRESLIKYLLKEISKGIEEGYDVRDIAKRIEKLVNSRNFYRWQALRIARTETTAAANYGASIASGNSIYVLEKVWISSNDARTRQIEKGDKFDHIDMDAVKVGEKDLFSVQGDFLRFPGDLKGRPSNIINCRCTMALQPKRDKDGKLIRK